MNAYAGQRAIMPLFGACRTIHADVLVASGRWDDAESALEDALAAHGRGYRAMGAPTLSTLASLRVRQGRLAEAEQLLAGREEEPTSLLALAELRLAEGEPRVAAALLERALAVADDDVFAASRLLGPLVVANLAAGAQDAAADAAQRLGELAAVCGRPLVEARAELAAARVARAERRKADAAAALLRDLGGGTPAGLRGACELTAREREVLAVVSRGLTNAQIAKTLFISEKTAGHHVSRILSKLGVRNRAQAATHAARLDAP